MLHYVLGKNVDGSFLCKLGGIIQLIDEEAQLENGIEEWFVSEYECSQNNNVIIIWALMTGDSRPKLKKWCQNHMAESKGLFVWMDLDEISAIEAYGDGADSFLLLPLEDKKVRQVMDNILWKILKIKGHSGG